MNDYVDFIYEVVKLESEDMDAVYGDFIQHLVGVVGLNTLLMNKLLESCGVVNGRQLYVLVKKES